jgi:hypothetical protein
MANTRNGNSFYIDTVYSGTPNDGTELLSKNIKVDYITLTTAGTAGKGITLGDAVTGVPKIKILNGTASDTKEITLWENQITFPNGIRVLALDTSCTCTCLVTESKG